MVSLLFCLWRVSLAHNTHGMNTDNWLVCQKWLQWIIYSKCPPRICVLKIDGAVVAVATTTTVFCMLLLLLLLQILPNKPYCDQMPVAWIPCNAYTSCKETHRTIVQTSCELVNNATDMCIVAGYTCVVGGSSCHWKHFVLLWQS